MANGRGTNPLPAPSFALTSFDTMKWESRISSLGAATSLIAYPQRPLRSGSATAPVSFEIWRSLSEGL